MLEVKNAACGYGKRVVARNISFSAAPGEIISILGANGAGKTTLFKSILGHLSLLGGQVLLGGEKISNISRKRLANVIGYVPQAHTPPFPFKVLDVVTMGRTSHISIFAAPSKKDTDISREALKTVGMLELEDKIYTEISGGERQLVLIARALAQQPEILVMDEPTANLDFGNQVKMLMLINELAVQGLAVIMTTHFPDHTFMCSSKVAIIKNSDDFLIGSADEVITAKLLRDIYGIDVTVEKIILEDRVATICVPLMKEKQLC